jgi:2-succinyl-5-enolpyruvyl-6-hydroxy-3-cyclohexene-1-carboxylate synthase
MTDVKVVHGFSTVGGFGIDGGTSAMIGTSLANPNRLNFGVFGDLSFFYDLNSIGSRHIGKNIRILVINNGEGGEFLVPDNIYDNSYCGDRVHDFISAQGHFGSKSDVLLKHFAEDLGFRYLSASTKEEFDVVSQEFIKPESSSPMILECFTSAEGDRKALDTGRKKAGYADSGVVPGLKSVARAVLPSSVKKMLKTAIKG